MSVNRRKFLTVSALTAGSLGLSNSIFGRQLDEKEQESDEDKSRRFEAEGHEQALDLKREEGES